MPIDVVTEQDWLYISDQFPHLAAASAKRLPGTCAWLLQNESYLRWKTQPNSFRWLHGPLGCGKSVATAAVVNDLLDDGVGEPDHDGKISVAYYFFDDHNTSTQDLRSLLRSWINQLSPSLGPDGNDYEASSRIRPVLDDVLSRSIEHLISRLTSIVAALPQVYLIVDALEVCCDRPALLDLMQMLINMDLSNLHTLVTSRTLFDINRTMTAFLKQEDILLMYTSLPVEEKHRYMVDDFIHPHADDIQCLVQTSIKGDERLAILHENKQLCQKVEAVLIQGAGGIFHWVEQQLEVLRECSNEEAVELALLQHPQALYKVYEQILISVDAERKRCVRDLLQWLIFATPYQPLSIQKLSEIITVDTEGPKPMYDATRRLSEPLRVLDLLSGLVVLAPQFSWQYGSIIRVDLVHPSLKAYLLSAEIKDSAAGYFALSEPEAHATVALMSLAYLHQFETRESLTRNRTAQSLLRTYTAIGWTTHARAAGDQWSVHISSMAKSWFNSSLFAFATAKSAQSYMVEAGLIEDLQQLIEDCEDLNDAFCVAIHQGETSHNWDMAHLLLDSGKVDLRFDCTDGTLFEELLEIGYKPLISAALNSMPSVDNDIMQQTLESSDLDESEICMMVLNQWKNKRDSDDSPDLELLSMACKRLITPAVESLLDMFTTAELQSSEAACEAFLKDNQDIRNLFLTKGVTLPPQNDLIWDRAILRNLPNIISQLLEAGSPVPPVAITKAVQSSKPEIIRILGHHNVPMNNKSQPNPLTLSFTSMRPETDSLLAALLDAGAGIDFQDAHGTALRAAIAGGYQDIVRVLLEHGADPTVQRTNFPQNKEEISADGTAFMTPNAGRRLVQISRELASTPLETAVCGGWTEIVRMLLDHGVDVDQRSEGGVFAYAIEAAWAMRLDEIYDELVARGADVRCLEENERVRNLRQLIDEEKEKEQERLRVAKQRVARQNEENMARQTIDMKELLQNVEAEWRRGELCWVHRDPFSRD